MSAKKLTPPANAPKIPKGWVYMGVDWDSKVPVRYAVWAPGNCDWDGVKCTYPVRTGPGMGNHYITPVPAPAKAKRAGKPVKAVKASTSGEFNKGPLFHIAGRGHCSNVYPVPIFVLPADADSVARMVEQAAKALAVADYKDETHAAEAMLAAIGIAGRRK